MNTILGEVMNDEFLMEEIFSSGGLLSKFIPDFQEREGQIQMAKLISRCYKEDRKLIVEAGTGIGKSFAYLAPAIKAAITNNERTVIATSTKTLQKQLFDKDIPLLSSVLGVKVGYVILMGRNNYLCLTRYKSNDAFQNLFLMDPASPEARFSSWVRETSTGLLEDYKGVFPPGVLKSDISSDQELCLGRKCPNAESCFYFKSRKEAEKAAIIVTNHHLLFSDAARRAESEEGYEENAILPSFSRLVIDECHNIDKNATSFFSQVFSSYEISYILRKLIYIKYTNEGLNLVQVLARAAGDEALGETILARLDAISRDGDLLNNALNQLMVYKSEVKVDKSNFIRLNSVIPAILALSQLLKDVYDKGLLLLSNLKDGDADELKVRSFQSAINTLLMLSDVLNAFSDPVFKDCDVRYLKKFRTQRSGEITEAAIAPLSIAPLLDEYIFSKLDTVICCSATLKVDADFGYFRKQVGLTGEDVLTACYLSPFDYAHNLLLLSSLDGAIYNNKSEEAYVAKISPMIKESIISSGGGALVLFTSYKMMQSVFEAVQEELSDFNLLIQGGGLPRNKLFEQFKSDKDSVLFATQSFWEGVDAPGDTLRLVIITKLPFPQVQDPVFQARCEKAEQESPNSSFIGLSFPEMVMKLKQGVGRLIRCNEDRGVVYIMDSRFNKYRSLILSQLPSVYAPEDVMESSITRRIENFF